MPRVSTLIRPPKPASQGATPRFRPGGGAPGPTGQNAPYTGYGPNGRLTNPSFVKALEKAAKGLGRGSGIPKAGTGFKYIPINPMKLSRLLPGSPLQWALALGWEIGEFAYEIYEERELWGAPKRVQYRQAVPPTETDGNPFDMTGWTEKLAWQNSLAPVNNPPNFIWTVTGDMFWGDFWTTAPGGDTIPGDDQKALPYQEPFGGTWWRSFDDATLETAGEFTTTQWISNTDGAMAPNPQNDGWYRGSWTRNPGTVGAPVRVGGYVHQNFVIETNPNIRRLLLSSFDYAPGLGTAVNPPSAKLDPVSRSMLITSTGDKMKGPEHKMEPPSGRRRQAPKVLDKTKKIAIALFKALDRASETAEIIDAIYEALPQDVKDRWGKGRDKRGLIDSAGQYGIDGADWKAQAIWHNAHRIDTVKAIKNIIANEYQDRIMGLIHRNTPVNTGQATSGAMKEVNKEVENFLKTLGF